MRVRIESAAQSDLIEGYHFYENSEAGVGEYFLATLYADIESLRVFGGIHRREYKDLYRASANSPSPFITPLKTMRLWCVPYWTADEIHHGFARE